MVSSSKTTAEQAAGLFSQKTEPEKEADFEFFFTRSVEFRQETIYFIVVDRFLDGDLNNDEGPNPNLYDPSRQHWGKYWGGDLEGVIQKLDYLKDLGVTAIWLSPLFEQVEDMAESAAMHGYWTKDFKRINSRFIAKGEPNSLYQETVFDRLVAEMHKRGMKLILDIVCNHSSPDINGQKGKLYDDGQLIADYYDDRNGWYYHNPSISDWNDQNQLLCYEMMGLATFNENNSDYRNYIKTAIKQWLDKGVDALRIDTIKHMPVWFWQEFLTDLKTHKPALFTFGEWGFGHPNDGRSPQFVNDTGMSIVDFGLCFAIREAIAQNQSGGFHRIQAIFDCDHYYNSATELITFFDNHDMCRFLSLNGNGNKLRLAVALILTCRGIPCLYYGTEQYLHNDTNGGNDPYNRPMMSDWNTDNDLYKTIGKLSQLRRKNPAISLGSQQQKYLSDDIYVYVRRYRDSRCLVILNKGGANTINIDKTEFRDGNYHCVIADRSVSISGGGITRLNLSPDEVIVLSDSGEIVAGQMVVRVQLNGVQTNLGETVVVTGDCPELGNWDIDKAYPLEYINQNTWFGEIPFNESAGKAIAYKYAIIRPDGFPTRENITNRRWILASTGTVKWRNKWAG
ncbi:MAG TPA: cyclomaltodextrin glucanotransferase [Cyanothece sp. UBA12306]|nr:cyclomaltodextrin glucanotransferase [Cyanothece sp. UBA12306]